MNKTNPSVHLRAIEPEDLDLLYRIENDVKLWNVGITNVPYSRYTLHDYVANATYDIYTDRQVRMMVENDQHEVVGIVDLVSFDPANRRAEVGLIILDAFRKQGYGSSVLEALANYALTVVHLHQLYAYCLESNDASRRLFSRCGFEQSGLLKDWFRVDKTYENVILMQKIIDK